jgi:WhiB family redox-sensing transcriptional regulator
MRAEWMHRAICRDEDPELFFPAGTDGPALLQAAAAKAVCARCPIRAECLEFALEHLPYGVAGGLDEDERRAFKRHAAPTRARTA